MIHHEGHGVTLWHGDCLDVLRQLEPCSVDSVVTDPPYGLEFMGKEWDKFTDAPLIKRSGHDDANSGAGMTEARGIYPKARNTSGVKFGNAWTYECTVCQRRDMMQKGCRCETPSWSRVLVNGAAPVRAFQAWCTEWAAECLRVLKPGGHLLAFGGTRTWHRLACAIEDAGFEIRDALAWMYGSGFPKSLDVSKAIDRAAGAEREVVGSYRVSSGTGKDFGKSVGDKGAGAEALITAPATPDAARWQGWGTALKPAYEPIVLARKPLASTVAGNVLAHGTGALNIDACRVGASGRPLIASRNDASTGIYGDGLNGSKAAGSTDLGRWPANVILDDTAAAQLDQQSGLTSSGLGQGSGSGGIWSPSTGSPAGPQHGDSGGASRFFKVTTTTQEDDLCLLGANDDGTFTNGPIPPGRSAAGVSSPAAPAGLPTSTDRFMYTAKADSTERPRVDGVAHPTVKPLDLMRWLVRLVTPPGGTVLEPFAGSGTTVEACLLEGFRCVAVEREADYLPLIVARITRQRDPVAHTRLVGSDEPTLFDEEPV